MQVSIQGLSKSFGRTPVLSDFSLEVADGEFISVLGPSGVGKTTLLRILAGLDTAAAGVVRFDGFAPAGGNEAVLVFQDYVLFPFLTVYRNVAFGLEARRLSKHLIADRVGRVLSHFGLSEQAGRYPAQLSGGQKQRVALARALAVAPKLLLLDEPLANLDKNLKRDTALYLRSVQREFGITTICVTHDQDEAMAISDRIAVMLGGRIAQVGTPQSVYFRPVSPGVARFMGPVSNLPESQITGGVIARADTADICLLRPEQLRVRKQLSGAFQVQDVRLLGSYQLCVVTLNGVRYEAFTSQPVPLQLGDRVEFERVIPPFEEEYVYEASS